MPPSRWPPASSNKRTTHNLAPAPASPSSLPPASSILPHCRILHAIPSTMARRRAASPKPSAASLPSSSSPRRVAPRKKPGSKPKPTTPFFTDSVRAATFASDAQQVIISLSNVQKGLQHVQNGLNDLMSAYIKHTSSVLAGEDGGLESLQLPDNVAETANAAMAAAGFAVNSVAQSVNHAVAVPAAAAATTAAAAPVDNGKNKKRKREKKEKDPNAPKRPLTAAFLYAQAARPVVKRDLESELQEGQKLEPNAVQIEITKRWNESSEEEKEQWKASYRDSMEKWKQENAAYLAAKGDAAAAAEILQQGASDASDAEADEAEVEAEAGALDSDAESDSDDEVTSPVAKAPSPPAAKTPRPNKRQKTAATNGAAAPIAIASTSVPLPLGRQVTAIKPPTSVGTPAAEASAKKDSKKKKAAPQVIAPAPATEEAEAATEDLKKKPKNGRSTRNAEATEESAEKEKPAARKRDRTKRKSEAGTS